MKAQRIHTTGRLASRMTLEEQRALRTRLEKWAPQKAEWKGAELEIGMGNGLALLERAKANPDGFYIGSEIYLNGLEVLARELEKKDAPENVRLLAEDGREVLERVPAGSLRRVLVLFPDPWPKAKHHKRRIVQAGLLDGAAKALQPGGELWVVTDWPSYAFHAIGVMAGHKAFTMAQTEGVAADCKPSARLGQDGEEPALGPHLLAEAPAWWVETKYQAKAKVAGRGSWYLSAVRK
jgi:tRNA (guanine-N7-)-methyltransferase